MMSVWCDVIGCFAGGGRRRRTRLWGVLLPRTETRIGMQVCDFWLLWVQFCQVTKVFYYVHVCNSHYYFSTSSPPPPPLSPALHSSYFPSFLPLIYSSLPALPPNLISSLCIVATIVGGNRTPQQCLHRWKNSLHPGIKKGRWSPEEDEVCFVKFHSC